MIWDLVGSVVALAAAGLTGTLVWRWADSYNRAKVANAEARKWEAMRRYADPTEQERDDR